jgi:Ser/Thr protein kinase RdoA (MazF antagonist)
VPIRDGDDSLAVPTDEGRALRVFDFVDGPVLARTTPDAEQLAEVGAVLGRLDVALARFTHPADGRGLVWDIRHFHHLTGLVEHTPDPEHRRAAREVFRLFGDTVVPRLSDLETQMIHGDYSPHNVVVDPRGRDYVTGVIDFGDAVRSAVIFDPPCAWRTCSAGWPRIRGGTRAPSPPATSGPGRSGTRNSTCCRLPRWLGSRCAR